MAVYANAFSVRPGACFRLVVSENPGQQGAPDHCGQPVVVRGRWQDGAGVWRRVEACAEHSVPLRGARSPR